MAGPALGQSAFGYVEVTDVDGAVRVVAHVVGRAPAEIMARVSIEKSDMSGTSRVNQAQSVSVAAGSAHVVGQNTFSMGKSGKLTVLLELFEDEQLVGRAEVKSGGGI